MNAVSYFNQDDAAPATLTRSTGTLHRSVEREVVGHDLGRMASRSFGTDRKPDAWNVPAFAAPPLDGPRIPSSPLHEF